LADQLRASGVQADLHAGLSDATAEAVRRAWSLGADEFPSREPPDIATDLKAELMAASAGLTLVRKFTVTPPGYVNVWLDDAAVAAAG
jgi:hypothetical protein